ncbi:MAG: hypothetical protein PHE84_01755 [bacterium]|nr:hypothetical protein [bacterium]
MNSSKPAVLINEHARPCRSRCSRLAGLGSLLQIPTSDQPSFRSLLARRPKRLPISTSSVFFVTPKLTTSLRTVEAAPCSRR